MSLADARLFHVNVNCSDLERSRRFYTDGLGLTIGAHTAPETTQPGAAFGLDAARWDASILLGPRAYAGGAIDLLQWHEPAPIGRPPAAVNETGFQRIGIRVADLHTAIARINDFGGRTWSEPFAHALPGGGEIRLVFAEDPDGTAMEVMERGPAAFGFVAITCADLEASRAFYRGLGFTEAARFPSESDDGVHLHVDGPVAMDEIVLTSPGGGDVFMMLVGFHEPACISTPPRAANTLGMWRAAFLVADLDGAVSELARQDIETISPPVTMAMGPGLPELRFVCFRGPDHEVIELIEQPSQ